MVHSDQTRFPTEFQADGGSQTPPFWELERLIDQGFTRDLALDVLATRPLPARASLRFLPRHGVPARTDLSARLH
ncbi:hypothetical protein IP69_09600 [Bosea sp. AAP35]|nr:hypothetical protein IP69_09600 [Bosea sp. AAP35]